MKKELKEYVIERFMDGNGDLDDDEQLFESGIIDSIGFVKMLSFIEITFNIPIDISDFTIESGTINGILDVMKNKSGLN